MKVISLWQPWASAIALGLKTYETRSWPTTYRGPLAIHAVKRLTPDQEVFWSTDMLGRLPVKLPLRLFYYDSQGDLDEILVKDGRFNGFRPVLKEVVRGQDNRRDQ